MRFAVAFILTLVWLTAARASDKPDQPKPIATVVGQKFKIVLLSNPSTGYHWLLAKPLDKSLLKQIGKSYKRPRTNREGAAGKEELVFIATGEGKTEIRLKYARLWEQDAPAAQSTNFVVLIKASAP